MRSPRQFLILLFSVLVMALIAAVAGQQQAESTSSNLGGQSPVTISQDVLAEDQFAVEDGSPSLEYAATTSESNSSPAESAASKTETADQSSANEGSAASEIASGSPDDGQSSLSPVIQEHRVAKATPTASPIPFQSPTPTASPILFQSPTPTPSSTSSPTPSMTSSPATTPSQTPLLTPTGTPTPQPTPQFVNGVSSEEFIIMDDETRNHIREIYLDGQTKGRDPRTLSRIGASIIETDQFLVRFGTGDYELGPYTHLQPVVDFFAPSLERYGVGIRRGLSAWMVVDASRSDKSQCEPDEIIVACELRLNNPSVLIIVLGTNDIGSVERFEESMRQIIEYSLSEGVIPILSSKADRYEGRDNRNNEVLHRLADEYHIPLWDFDVVAQTLPGKGLARDNVHLTFLYEFDFNQPNSMQRGYGLYNITALMVLDEVWSEMKSTAFGYPTSR